MPRTGQSAGYSATPLARKLGIKSGMSVVVLHGPADFADILGPLPDGATLHRSLRPHGATDLLVAFVTERSHLEKHATRLVSTLPADGTLWVAWPKKASRIITDMSDQVVRDALLPTGWVDTKVCAIDDTWSGLKFVLRKALRPATR